MTRTPAPSAAAPAAATYKVRLKGHLDVRWASRLGVPGLVHEPDGTTIMRGVAADQAALHGLLQRIRDLGLELIAVVRTGPGQPD